jgi:hypothetical protein
MKQKDILTIIILFFLFTLAWIGSSFYHSAINSTISEDIDKDIAPIAPTLDSQAVNKLKSREKISPSYEFQGITPTPITLPNLPSSPNASQGGKLML